MRDAEQLTVLIDLAVSLGIVTAVGAFARYVWNRWRWRNFRRAVPKRIQDFVERVTDIDHPKEMGEEHWLSFVEERLSDAGFSPFEIALLAKTGVASAKTLIPERNF